MCQRYTAADISDVLAQCFNRETYLSIVTLPFLRTNSSNSSYGSEGKCKYQGKRKDQSQSQGDKVRVSECQGHGVRMSGSGWKGFRVRVRVRFRVRVMP